MFALRQQRTKVTLIEVGARDGLQNEKQTVKLVDKVKMLKMLEESGLRSIEVGSFVSPKWIPQMADTEKLFKELNSTKVNYSCLVPNERGMAKALLVPKTILPEVSVFTTASETFSQKNVNCTIEESLKRIRAVLKMNGGERKVRAYISCAIGCPYEGPTDPHRVKELVVQLVEMGCYQVSLGDTIGVGSASKVKSLLKIFPDTKHLAVHFHDTYGQGLANVLASLDYGIEFVDSSVGGLGGCPYAPGAAGNIATEEVAYMLNEMQLLNDPIDIDVLINTVVFASKLLGRPLQSFSKLSRAMLSKRHSP